ncbi:hypothetical protein HYALB_00009687 [Hymenoscyphus albidus]|uniref:GMC oxidoreductase n=1 Tax=Hymenoscyphus albidus TaxID=595503 RepID=A0A9N9Q179_9HELO|nr:hypothetical protein HYALB_00009687 [Hymenoscyphus albidus]
MDISTHKIGAFGRICQAISVFLFIFAIPTISSPLYNSEAPSAAGEYDYVVVGSGPGGGTVASNLARAGYSVLLVEAGDLSNAGSDSARQNRYSHLTWRTKEGSYRVGRDNPPAGAKLLGFYYPKGSTVGGSSMINQMVTFLPPESDWNYIANLTGDQSWSAANMRSVFTRIEHKNYLTKGTAGHGFDGFFQVSMAKAQNVQNPGLAVLNAAAATFNQQTSQVTTLLNTDPNRADLNRDQTISIFSLPSKFNLTLSVNSLVTRALFSSTKCDRKPRATSVEFLTGKSIYKADPRYNSNNKGTIKQVTAWKEVIISGGAFNTPQILMLKTNHALYNERDILVFHGPFVFRGFWPSNQTNVALPNDPVGVYGMSMVKMHPQNTAGTVKLTSSNPQDIPDINFNLSKIGRETDLGAMKDVVTWARGVYGAIKAPAGPVKLLEPPPGKTKAEDEDWITAQTFGHHPTSTSTIGSDNDPMAVLDSRFRVRGVTGLRVVDASTFPRIPGVFPVVATFMVGQKGSDTIIEDVKKPDVC